MKQLTKIGLALAVLLSAYNNTDAQIYVRVRPPRPAVVVTARPPQPTPRHVWVEEDWRPYRRSYRWHGGYWVAPPRPAAVWIPGHWQTTRRGDRWIPGHWR